MAKLGKLSAISSKFEWKIDDFLSCNKEDSFESPDFDVSYSSWCIQIFPCGDTDDSKDYISLYLWNRDSEPSPITLEYTLGIKTVHNTIVHKDTGSDTFIGNAWGWSRFIKRSDLLEKSSELLPSGNLTVTCLIKSDNTGPDFDSSRRSLADDFKELFISEEGSDATLHVKETKFPVHRTILAARSPVFAAMFRNDTIEKKTGEVKILDSDPEAFSEFLAFLYTGEAEFTKCNVCELYKISDKYDVPKLNSMCVHFLENNLSVENFCEIIILSDQFEEKELLTDLKSFFNDNFVKIVSSESWEVFLTENPLLANALLKAFASSNKFPSHQKS